MHQANIKSVSDNVIEAAFPKEEIILNSFDANSLICQIAIKSGVNLIYLHAGNYDVLRKIEANRQFGSNLFKNLMPTFMSCNDLKFAEKEYHRMKSIIEMNPDLGGFVKLALYRPDGHYFVIERNVAGFLTMSER